MANPCSHVDMAEVNEGPKFCFPIKGLDSTRVRLTPFIVAYLPPELYDVYHVFLTTSLVPYAKSSKHAQAFFDGSYEHPSLYRHTFFGPFSSCADFLQWHDAWHIRSNPHYILFAIFDKTQSDTHPTPRPELGPLKSQSHNETLPGALAGVIGLFDASPQHASIEIGPIIVFPMFQRTHVSRNAIGLVLHYCLDLPAQGGLGLRRVQWRTKIDNLSSIYVAERMGFVKEAIIRWEMVLPPEKGGEQPREGDPTAGPGRHNVLLAICWDDWEARRHEVDKLMDQGIE